MLGFAGVICIMRKIISIWREKTGIWGVCILWLPFYTFFGGISGRFFFFPLYSVLSGKYWKWFDRIFVKPFPKECAGFALDQPTVGKFFFWYTALSVFALTFAIIIRALTDMQKKTNRRAYFVFYVLAFLFVLSFMLWPATILAHYIIDLGMTPKRLTGIIFLVTSILAWPVSGWLLLRIKKPQEQ